MSSDISKADFCIEIEYQKAYVEILKGVTDSLSREINKLSNKQIVA